MNSTTEMGQRSRQVAVKTALPDDALAFRRMRYAEGLCELFEMELELVSDEPDIDPYKVLGRNLTVRLECQNRDAPRFFNGFVTRFAYAGRLGRACLYRATAAPWLWMLEQTSDSRIFHEKSVREIVTDVFEQAGFSDFELKADLSARREYTVQYQETNLAFVSRLLEREGACWFFEHENGAHKLIVADEMGQHDEEEGYEKLVFAPPDEHMRLRLERVHEWTDAAQIRPTKVELQDFDFKNARADLTKSDAIARDHALSSGARYDYPGGYVDPAEGERYAKLRVEALQARHREIAAESTVRGVAAGRRFTLEEHPDDRQNAAYLVVESSYEIDAGGYESADDAEVTVENRFRAIPAEGVFRPPLKTPRPRIVGPQTAIVTGGEGREIDLDEHGRVQVSFHWEREGLSSRRVRVAQVSAGAQWGAAYWPRIGQEVIVEFLDGDPDRPIVTGRVYNNVSEPPYDPVAHGTRSTFKTSSSPGGGGFNELRFEDKAGEEHVFLHSQKDTHLRTRNDHVELVGANEHQTVGGSAYRSVGGDAHETVGGDDHLTVGGVSNVKVGLDHLLDAGMNIIAQAGIHAHVKAGMDVVIEAGAQITLKVGGNFISIGPAGVDIVGSMVKINSGGAPGTGLGTSPKEADKPISPHEADAGGTSPAARSRSRSTDREWLDSNPAAAALLRAAESGAPFCEICAKKTL